MMPLSIIQHLLARAVNIIGICVLLFSMVIVRSGASSGGTPDDHLKDLMQRYEEVEGQLDRSLRYAKKTESKGTTTIEQAWYNGAGNLIKVASDRIDPSGRELTE